MTTAQQYIAIRVDASPRIGSGHFMRCLALARALSADAWRACFVTRDLPAILRGLVQRAGHELIELQSARSTDTQDTIHALEGRRWDWLAVDHYALDARWESALRQCAPRILVIDDLADRAHDCDLLIDQNLRPDAGAGYDGLLPRGCDRLLGPRYALLDGAFAAARCALGTQSRERLLVSFGASDPQSLTMPVLRALLDASGNRNRIDVVVGPLHRDAAAIREFAAGAPNVDFHHATPDMANLMARARLFIGAGGSTSWERCCLALPGVVVSTAANQEAVCRALDDAGSHVYLGRAAQVPAEAIAQTAMAVLASPDWCRRLSDRSSAIVDGQGARRVATRLEIGEVRLREATAQDEARLLEWRNDPGVRRYSGDSTAITPTDHAHWLARALVDPNCHLLLAEDAHGALGVLRYDIRAGDAKVSIYLAPPRLGGGVGSALLAAGERWLAARRPDLSTLTAEVHAENRASVRLFSGAGFHMDKMTYAKKLNGRKIH